MATGVATCSISPADRPLRVQFVPSDGARLQGGFMVGNDPRARQQVLDQIAFLRVKHSDNPAKHARFDKEWDDAKSRDGAGYQLAFSQELLSVEQGQHGLVVAAEVSHAYIRHTADNLGKYNGHWGPAANHLLFRTGGTVGYCRKISDDTALQADALAGVNLATMDLSMANCVNEFLPNSTATYVGGRVSILPADCPDRFGAFLQLDDDITGPSKGNVRGTLGVTYKVEYRKDRDQK